MPYCTSPVPLIRRSGSPTLVSDVARNPSENVLIIRAVAENEWFAWSTFGNVRITNLTVVGLMLAYVTSLWMVNNVPDSHHCTAVTYPSFCQRLSTFMLYTCSFWRVHLDMVHWYIRWNDILVVSNSRLAGSEIPLVDISHFGYICICLIT